MEVDWREGISFVGVMRQDNSEAAYGMFVWNIVERWRFGIFTNALAVVINTLLLKCTLGLQRKRGQEEWGSVV